MHVENNLVEFVTVDGQEYEEIVEEYEEEILVPEEFPELPVTDTAIGSAPAQGKPRCIPRIFELV
jgi:hypothetical protein